MKYFLISILTSVFLLFSCGESQKRNEVKKEKVPYFSISFTKNPAIFSLHDTIEFTLNLVNKEIFKGVASFYIDDEIMDETFGNENTYSVYTNKISEVGDHILKVELPYTDTVYTSTITFRFLSNVAPKQKSFIVKKTYPHDVNAYTQGLEFFNNQLFEGIGLNGKSEIRSVELETGKVLKSKAIDQQYFGEGITILNNKLIQLTWQSNIGFVYDLKTFEKLSSFNYATEGWGLCNNGVNLIMSDGSNKLYFLDTANFSVVKTLQVYDNYDKVDLLNELEWVDGYIYANVYTKNNIVKIDSKSGIVVEKIDLKGILPEKSKTEQTDVLNGIAFNKKTGKMYITGKNWPSLFEVTFVESVLP
ncbi:MAG: glutaminyl-peptide cyclotransferase [Bacteroidales bacterium]|nr:glutaminyl-peptide cyclotransferase [Bacteroidales bacterium]